MRAALYARFSTDQQNVGSIADQLRICRAHAAKLGATQITEFDDAAISGQAIGNRPGLLALLAAAKAGAFDLVIAEHTDRLSRSGSGSWSTYEDLTVGLGIPIDTVNQGRITAMHVGMSSTMSVMMIEEGRHKTRRGLEGVVRSGRNAGGKSFGYRLVRKLDEHGQLLAGLLEIDDAEADLVREVYRRYAAGESPRSIAADFNTRGIPGPRGGPWNASTINGNAARGNGLLHNELYRGVRVWGRQTWTKDRVTGSRRARAAAGDAIREVVEDLRIVDDGLWSSVRAQYQAISLGPTPHAQRPKRILSGLVRCGSCGGAMTAGGPGSRFQCTVRKEKGPALCPNGRTAKVEAVEQRVITAVRDNLLHPDAIEAAMQAFHEAAARKRKEAAAGRAGLERQLAEVIRRADRLVDQVAEGSISGKAVANKLAELEAQRAQLEQQLAAEPSADVIAMHPGLARRYRDLVDALQATLGHANAPELLTARDALRALVTAVRVIPLQKHGAYDLEIVGDLTSLLAPVEAKKEVRKVVGAGAGFEPATFRL